MGKVELQVISGPDALTMLLHGHLEIVSAIRTLVARRFAGRRVRLPVAVGRVTAPPIVRQLPSWADRAGWSTEERRAFMREHLFPDYTGEPVDRRTKRRDRR